jgi:hypothetical protein
VFGGVSWSVSSELRPAEGKGGRNDTQQEGCSSHRDSKYKGPGAQGKLGMLQTLKEARETGVL